jgi:ribosome recycling factor
VTKSAFLSKVIGELRAASNDKLTTWEEEDSKLFIKEVRELTKYYVKQVERVTTSRLEA